MRHPLPGDDGKARLAGFVAARARDSHIPGMRAMLPVAALLVMAAAPAASPACGPAIAAAERAYGTAPGLLAAIGLVESGRTDPRSGTRSPWPWTVTAEGIGTFYPGKPEAIRAVEALRVRGVQSVDVGCMQVNLLHHPGAFHSLDEAFDPAANATYAAAFLTRLHARVGSWPAAASAYHSLTPKLGEKYGQLIAAVWSGAAVPVAEGSGGAEVVVFPGGGQLRLVRDLVNGPGRVSGLLLGP